MKNRKRFGKLALTAMAVAAAALLTGCGAKKEAQTLNLFTWDGMFPQEVLSGFEEEYNIKINYTNFEYDEEMLAKLETAKGGDYDLVIADDYIIDIAVSEGLVQKLDKSALTNWGNIDPAFQGQFYDETDEYTVPYGAGIPLIVYDPALVDFEITGYEDLWNPSLKDNVALIGNYRVIDGIVLKTMGYSFNINDTAVIEEAGKKLLQLAPNVRLINDNNTQDYIISGEAAVAFLYTSQVTQAVAARPDLKVVYPKEGLGFGIMAGFIPSQAPNADAAHKFLDYILRPEISAQCFEYIGYVCTTKAAVPYMSKEAQASLSLPEGAQSGEFIMDISGEANEVHERIWTEFKAALD
ncbi:MAG: spermidine/putrescine ABC transporter substrate-binding protein [Lachnospiraceae bacterium]|nr:spermidine/putrescine ABC transporter substrate-binding protein [Lachnospiraceae bacterium]